jgi:hypothetical protein
MRSSFQRTFPDVGVKHSMRRMLMAGLADAAKFIGGGANSASDLRISHGLVRGEVPAIWQPARTPPL